MSVIGHILWFSFALLLLSLLRDFMRNQSEHRRRVIHVQEKIFELEKCKTQLLLEIQKSIAVWGSIIFELKVKKVKSEGEINGKEIKTEPVERQ